MQKLLYGFFFLSLSIISLWTFIKFKQFRSKDKYGSWQWRIVIKFWIIFPILIIAGIYLIYCALSDWENE
jgi:hypothetical protein